MDSFSNDKQIELIGKFLSGEATPEEAMMMDDWLATADNRREFEVFQRLWHNAAPGSMQHELPSVQTEWIAFRKNIATKQKSSYNIKRFAIAASIILLLSPLLLLMRSGSKKLAAPAAFHSIGSTQKNMQQVLPDGTVVTIKKNSLIRYDDSFGIKERQLTLQGEGYFVVQHDAVKPFSIHIDKLTITDIGTVFNVKHDEQSKDVEVQVSGGKIMMSLSQQQLIIAAGQTGIYHAASNKLELINTVDPNQWGYATNNFVFTNSSLRSVLEVLQKAYGFEMGTINPKLFDCRITASFNNKSIGYILDVIDATLSISCTIEHNKLQVSGNGCN